MMDKIYYDLRLPGRRAAPWRRARVGEDYLTRRSTGRRKRV